MIRQKSPTQQLLELKKGRDIQTILEDTLDRYRGHHNLSGLVALDLGITSPTLYSWCHQFGIDVSEYRTPREPVTP